MEPGFPRSGDGSTTCDRGQESEYAMKQAAAIFLDAYREGKLVPVSRMNDGFMRPAYPEQIQFSYYQASLVCDMIVRDGGEKALTALLVEYKAGRTTEEAVRKVIGVDMPTLDRKFDAYMKERFAGPLAALAAQGPEYAAGMNAAQLSARADEVRGSWRAQMLAGTALARARQTAAAVRMFERAHALFPEFASGGSPAALLAEAYLARGDGAKALPMFKAVAYGDEASFDANMSLAVLALAARDTTTALEALERAVYINPFPADLHRTIATLAAARGDHVRAVREREALVALDPVDRAETLYQLALAYRRAGDPVKAKRTVLRALEEAPNFEKAQDLLLAIIDGRAP